MADALALCVSHPGPFACGSTHYDVFLSFPGGSDATPESFPGLLHACLAAAGVSVCGPDESQAIGSSSSLLPDVAVQRSKICIPILPQDYASSDRCLRRLVQMMEGKRSGRQMLLPIFNRVEPADPRHLKGSFDKARHSDIEGVQRALPEVSMIHGWKVTDWCEEELVKRVVKTVRIYLSPNFHIVPQSANYNVFLNFRGADSRHGIAYHLYKGLMDAGVSVFKDDMNIPIGEEFSSQLLSAISRSTIYITIFSPNYTSSKWCCHELKKMLQCEKSMGHMVLPIFHELSARQLRHQLKSFESASCFHETHGDGELDIMRGKETLLDVSHSTGFEIARQSDWRCDENNKELIEVIVRSILGLLRDRFQLDVPDHLPSIDDRMKSDYIM